MMTDDTEHNYGWPRTAGARLALVLGLIFAASQFTWFTHFAPVGFAVLCVLGFLAIFGSILVVMTWIASGEGGSEDPKNPNHEAGW